MIQDQPTRLQSALMWVATVSIPFIVAAVILGALASGLWVLSHINIQ